MPLRLRSAASTPERRGIHHLVQEQTVRRRAQVARRAGPSREHRLDVLRPAPFFVAASMMAPTILRTMRYRKPLPSTSRREPVLGLHDVEPVYRARRVSDNGGVARRVGKRAKVVRSYKRRCRAGTFHIRRLPAAVQRMFPREHVVLQPRVEVVVVRLANRVKQRVERRDLGLRSSDADVLRAYAVQGLARARVRSVSGRRA